MHAGNMVVLAHPRPASNCNPARPGRWQGVRNRTKVIADYHLPCLGSSPACGIY
jgi:hypothetical protein